MEWNMELNGGMEYGMEYGIEWWNGIWNGLLETIVSGFPAPAVHSMQYGIVLHKLSDQKLPLEEV